MEQCNSSFDINYINIKSILCLMVHLIDCRCTKYFMLSYKPIEIYKNTADLYMGISNNSNYRYLGQRWKWRRQHHRITHGNDRFCY